MLVSEVKRIGNVVFLEALVMEGKIGFLFISTQIGFFSYFCL